MKVRYLALAVALIALGGCTPDRAAVSGPSRALEGARVAGHVTDVTEIAGRGDAPVMSRWQLGTAIRRGEARGPDGGVLAVIAQRPRAPRREAEFLDSASGKRIRIEFDFDDAQGPASRIRTFVDGRKVVDLKRTWRREGDVFMLDDETADIFGANGRSIRQQRNVRHLEVAAVPAAKRAARELAAAAGAAFMPADAVATMACWKEWAAYSVATLALAVATEAVMVMPPPLNFAALAGWTAAWEKWREKLEALNTCMRTDPNPFPIIP